MAALFGLIGTASAGEAHGMAASMAHRGRRVCAWSPAPGVILGTCRQADEADDQCGPIAVDAELQTPKDQRASAQDPAALIGQLLSRSGPEAIASLRGFFSFAWWDEQHRSVWLGVDHLGYKRLYFTQLPDRIAFASEYKALLALTDFDPRPNRSAIQHYLAALNFPIGRTFLEGVCPVPPGTVLRLGGKEPLERRFWRPTARIAQRSRLGHAEALRATLSNVLDRQAAPFTRIAATLSAGLDSAGVLSFLRRVRPDLAFASFTIGSDERDPEILGAREVAEYFGTDHHEIFFAPEEVADTLPTLVWLMEDCGAREEALLHMKVMTAIGRQQRVVFGGYGADMLFGGMPRHRLVRLAEVLPGLSGPLRELYQTTQIGKVPDSLIGRALKYALYRGTDLAPPRVIGCAEPVAAKPLAGLDDYIADTAVPMHGNAYTEPIADVTGVQVRSPFLTPDMIDMALTIPARYKAGLRRQKMILRQVLADSLPDKVLRRMKAIQRLSHDAALSNVLHAMAAKLLDPQAVLARGFIDPGYMESFRRRTPAAGYSTQQIYRLWALLSTEIWARQFLDSRGDPSAIQLPFDAWPARAFEPGQQAPGGTVQRPDADAPVRP